MVRYRMGLFDSYLLSDPAFIKHVLLDNHEGYRKGPIFEKMESLIGKGLITSEGERWRRQRRLVQPVFQQKKVLELMPLVDEIVATRLDVWERQGEGPFDIVAEMLTLTMDIICASLFGRKALARIETISHAGLGFMDEVSEEILKLFRPLGLLLDRRPTRGPATLRLRAILRGIIEERRGPGGDEGSDLLALLLRSKDEGGRGMSEEDLLDEVMTLFVAGHETTAMALSWTFMLLGANPEEQRKLCEESAAGRSAYARMVSQEGMRLYPPVWSFPRRAIADDVIGGFRVPRGAFVVLSPWVMQRHPKYWTDPEAFLPERFGAEEEKRRDRYVYFPFGAAMRQCAGTNFALSEMEHVLTAVARRFSLELVPDQRITPVPVATLKPDRPIMMRRRPVHP